MVNAGRHGLLGEAEHQVVILAALEPDSKPSDLPDDFSPVHAQVARIHLGKKGVRRPVRLEEGHVPDAFFADFVLVAVDHVRIRMGIEQGGILVEGIGRDFVVMIQQGDELP